MGGQWLFRADPGGNGAQLGFASSASTAGWTPVTVPNAWNAKDYSDASFAGGVGWYRKDFHLPSRAKRLSWVVRFESVNYRSRVWLNGRLIGKNTRRLPAVRDPPARRPAQARRAQPPGHPRRRPPLPDRLPALGPPTTGVPTGGWWNYGGLLREVYLRKIDQRRLHHGRGPARPAVRAPATRTSPTRPRSATTATRPGTSRVTARLGARRIALGTASVGAKRFATFVKRVAVRNPRTWSPDQPDLYDTSG